MPRGRGGKTRGSAGNRHAPGRNLEFQGLAEPAFLQKFKARVGYRDDSNKLQDKFGSQDASEIQRELSKDALHNDEEKPQVVIPAGENIDLGEVDNYFELKRKEVNDDKLDMADDKNHKGTKIIFRKPDKDGKNKPNTFSSGAVVNRKRDAPEVEKANDVKISDKDGI